MVKSTLVPHAVSDRQQLVLPRSEAMALCPSESLLMPPLDLILSSPAQFLERFASYDPVTKLLCAIAIFVVAYGAAMIPLRIAARHGSDSHHSHHVIIKYGNAFSAGIFLAMGIVHLLPEASRAFDVVWGPGVSSRYHPAEALCVVGYALILALQRVVFPTPTCPHTLQGGDDDGHKAHHHTSREVSGGQCGAVFPAEIEGLLQSKPSSLSYGSTGTREHKTVVDDDADCNLAPQVSRRGSQKLARSSGCCRSGKHCVDEVPLEHNDSQPGANVSELSSNVAADDDAMKQTGPAHILLDRSERMARWSSQWTLVFALSIHAICEGLALGLQCGLHNVMVLASAICAHKWAESFALSSSLMHEALEPHHHHSDQGSHDVDPHDAHRLSEHGVNSRDEHLRLVQARRTILAFACATPIGVALGALMHSKLPPSTSGVVRSLSAGTFMYIGASEVVVEEFVQGRQYWGKWLCFVAGTLLMWLLTVFHN